MFLNSLMDRAASDGRHWQLVRTQVAQRLVATWFLLRTICCYLLRVQQLTDHPAASLYDLHISFHHITSPTLQVKAVCSSEMATRCRNRKNISTCTVHDGCGSRCCGGRIPSSSSQAWRNVSLRSAPAVPAVPAGRRPLWHAAI